MRLLLVVLATSVSVLKYNATATAQQDPCLRPGEAYIALDNERSVCLVEPGDAQESNQAFAWGLPGAVTGLCFRSDNRLFAAIGGGLVLDISAGGDLENSIPFATGLDTSMRSIIETSDGRLLVCQFDDESVMDVTPGGDFTNAPRFATGLQGVLDLIETSDGRLLVTKQDTGEVIDITTGGDFSNASPFAFGLDRPISIVEDQSGRILVGEEGDAEVTDITLGGDFTSAAPFAWAVGTQDLVIDCAGRLLASSETRQAVFDITEGGDFLNAEPLAFNYGFFPGRMATAPCEGIFASTCEPCFAAPLQSVAVESWRNGLTCNVAEHEGVLVVGGSILLSLTVLRKSDQKWNAEQVINFPGNATDIHGDIIVSAAGTVIAVYQYDGTAWEQIQTLTSSQPIAGAEFGASTSFDGTHLFASTLQGSGFVEVFRWDGTQFEFTQLLEPTDAVGHDRFGISLAVDGTSAAVGADLGGFLDPGAVYFYELVNNEFVLQNKSISPDEDRGHGQSLGLEGNRAVVGGFNRLYVYESGPGGWTLQHEIEKPQQLIENFAESIDIYGDWIAVAAPSEQDFWNAVYLFRRTGETWIEVEQFVTPSDEAYLGEVCLTPEEWIVVSSTGTFLTHFLTYPELSLTLSIDSGEFANRLSVSICGTIPELPALLRITEIDGIPQPGPGLLLTIPSEGRIGLTTSLPDMLPAMTVSMQAFGFIGNGTLGSSEIRTITLP